MFKKGKVNLKQIHSPSSRSLSFLSKSDGFTLVEVLVAILVLAIGLVMVIEVMGRTQQALRVSRNLVVASQLAEEQVVFVEMEARQDKELRTGVEKDEYEQPGRKYEVSRSIEPFYDEKITDETNINQIRVVIDWHDGQSKKGSLDLITLVANRIEMEELGVAPA